LYRKLRVDWVHGDRVLVEAIDTEGTSCDRERHRDPKDLIEPGWPRVGWVVPRDLPRAVKPCDVSPEWEFFALDLPERHNEAHCEIRARRVGRQSVDNDPKIKKYDRVVRERLKSELASRFRVL